MDYVRSGPTKATENDIEYEVEARGMCTYQARIGCSIVLR